MRWFALPYFHWWAFTPMSLPLNSQVYALETITWSAFMIILSIMRTPCTLKDSLKWGGFLEILAASLMYKRPVHIHIMDLTLEFRICFNDSHIDRQPILLSYEGRNHYNTLILRDHIFKDSRIGVEEMMVLSSTFLRSICTRKIVVEVITSEKLNMI